MGAPKQQGIALVLVLWVIVLLSVIAGAMSTVQRTGVSMTSNIRQEREGRALVNAGLNFMALMLERRGVPVEDNPWPIDGQLHPWYFAGKTIWVGAMPEDARIDINQVDPQVLQNLLESMGLEEDQAMAIRDAILDWKDPDNTTHIDGAEDGEYKAEGRPIGARDSAFLSLEELQQVYGITPELYKKLAGALTVDARQRTVDPAYASREVLLAMPNATPEEVDQYIIERQQALDQGLPVPLPTFGSGYLKKGRGNRYRLVAEVDLPGGGKAQGEMVIGMESKTRKGYMLLQKKYGKLQSLGRVAQAPEEG